MVELRGSRARTYERKKKGKNPVSTKEIMLDCNKKILQNETDS